ncbi:MAG TPA: DUF5654 family protein [Methanothermobacter sp.]|nr:conserved hypothetical protein [Methanothermobacter sp. MT-2]HHW05084.1 hypothetical protein [Methanothermobacter sp.]HOK73443.1 DUF5654 family protein [Methanothermobacter sp.]HOL68701.1 DUF5654 family protein [Methanothermobacter sp.]HPQ05345.1 DUF5654 family protein [Methanothermobacter sp.]
MSEIKEEVIKTMATLITTAFGLIAALAWNEAIKALIQLFFKAGNALTGLFVYAIIVTILAVIATIIIARSLAHLEIEMPED